MMLTAVTAGLFIALGVLHNSIDWVLMLVAVLFIHEAGHFVAMRVFGYRDVRMFFIPLFGAAVSGHHDEGRQSREALVALMGPLPGLVLAAALLIWEQQQMLPVPEVRKAVLLLVGLNGFNLLPLMPLDGGRVLHGVLFSRHPVLELFFKLAAAAGLGWLAWVLGLKVLGVLAVFLLLTVDYGFKIARLAQRLRREGEMPRSRSAGDLSPRQATLFVEALREQFPDARKPKLMGLHLWNLLQKLVTQPPGVMASLGLLVLWLLGLGGAFLLLSFVV
jgi:Zn-dependent protease